MKVVNVVLRLAWMQTVLGIKEAPFLHQRALVVVVGSLEIVRRGIWNFFRFDFNLETDFGCFDRRKRQVDKLFTIFFFFASRLENEHLNNVGKYRAFKSVPLPFQELGGSKSM